MVQSPTPMPTGARWLRRREVHAQAHVHAGAHAYGSGDALATAEGGSPEAHVHAGAHAHAHEAGCGGVLARGGDGVVGG